MDVSDFMMRRRWSARLLGRPAGPVFPTGAGPDPAARLAACGCDSAAWPALRPRASTGGSPRLARRCPPPTRLKSRRDGGCRREPQAACGRPASERKPERRKSDSVSPATAALARLGSARPPLRRPRLWDARLAKLPGGQETNLSRAAGIRQRRRQFHDMLDTLGRHTYYQLRFIAK